MKRRLLTIGVALAASLLAGCAAGTAAPVKSAMPEPSETTAAPVAETTATESREVPAAVLDIATTQAFTDEAVSAEDAEAILLAGINAPSAMNGQPWHFSAVTDSAVLAQIAEDMSAGMPGRFPGGPGAPGTPPVGDAATPPVEDSAGTPPVGDAATPPVEDSAGTPPVGDNATPPVGDGAGMPATPPTGNGAKAGVADAPLAIVVSCRDGSELDAGLACQNMSVAAVLMGYGTKIVTSPTIALNGAKQAQYRELLGIPEGYAAAAVLLVGRPADAVTAATPRNAMEETVTWVTP